MTREKMIEAITTAILGKTAPKAAAAVLDLCGPKKLVWCVEEYTATIGHRAGCYIVTQSKNGGVCFLSSCHPHNIGPLKYPTLEAAQSAAQSLADAAHWAPTPLGKLVGVV